MLPIRYKEEVLGARLEVLFSVNHSATSSAKWFGGIIVEYRVKMIKGQLEKLHLIIFDDGDEQFMDLQDLESQGHLRWPKHLDQICSLRMENKDDHVGLTLFTATPQPVNWMMTQSYGSNSDDDPLVQ